MKYLIEATGRIDKGEWGDVEIPVEIEIDGYRENTSILVKLADKDYWIPVAELDHLMYIIDGLVED